MASLLGDITPNIQHLRFLFTHLWSQTGLCHHPALDHTHHTAIKKWMAPNAWEQGQNTIDMLFDLDKLIKTISYNSKSSSDKNCI